MSSASQDSNLPTCYFLATAGTKTYEGEFHWATKLTERPKPWAPSLSERSTRVETRQMWALKKLEEVSTWISGKIWKQNWKSMANTLNIEQLWSVPSWGDWIGKRLECMDARERALRWQHGSNPALYTGSLGQIFDQSYRVWICPKVCFWTEGFTCYIQSCALECGEYSKQSEKYGGPFWVTKCPILILICLGDT